jgi:hypothetical protein
LLLPAEKNRWSHSRQTGVEDRCRRDPSAPQHLRRRRDIFESTGGLHAAALFNSEGGLESLRGDDQAKLLARRYPESAHLLPRLQALAPDIRCPLTDDFSPANPQAMKEGFSGVF